MKEIIKNLVYDYYNLRWRNDNYAGTLTSHTSTNGSGTFWVVIITDKESKNE